MRVGANAVIVRNQAILVVEFRDENGPHFNLPGGGIEAHESILDGLRREVKEETGAEVEPDKLMLVNEYWPDRFDNLYGPHRKLMLFFRCFLKPGSEPGLPVHPDANQVAVRWIRLQELPSAPLLPPIGARLVELLEVNIPEVFTNGW